MGKQKNNKDEEYKQCIYYCYGNFCNRNYAKEKKALGYSDLTEYRCTKKCYLFKNKSFIHAILRWLCG